MTKGRRFGVQVAILAILIAMAFVLQPSVFGLIVAIVVLVLPIANWMAFLILFRVARRNPGVASLIGRADDALSGALASTAAALIGVLSIARTFGTLEAIPPKLLLVMLAFVLVVLSVPAISWLTTWRSLWLPRIRKE